MAQLYAVYRSNLRRPRDRRVAGRSTRAGARRLAAALNARALARWGGPVGPDGRPTPLYYVTRGNQ